MDELFKNNAYRILELFMEFPTRDFSIRGIARQLNISHATVLKYITELQGLVNKNDETLYPTYSANTQNKKYQFYKKNHTVWNLINSGIVDEIQKNCLPSSIILFGSAAKGTDTEKSDIDIFVESEETPINVSRYEKALKRKINLLFEKNPENLSKELRNNILNGTILYGFMR